MLFPWYSVQWSSSQCVAISDEHVLEETLKFCLLCISILQKRVLGTSLYWPKINERQIFLWTSTKNVYFTDALFNVSITDNAFRHTKLRRKIAIVHRPIYNVMYYNAVCAGTSSSLRSCGNLRQKNVACSATSSQRRHK